MSLAISNDFRDVKIKTGYKKLPEFCRDIEFETKK